MSSITKKQASLALIVVAFAAVMIAGTIASSADNSVFAKKKHHSKHHGKSASVNQGISQSSSQSQNSNCLSGGAVSPITGSCINAAVSNQTNNGGNAAAVDQSG